VNRRGVNRADRRPKPLRMFAREGSKLRADPQPAALASR
jgi:hypothetical protein